VKVVWIILRKEILDIVRNRRRLVLLLLFAFIVMPIISVTPLILFATRINKQAVNDVSIPVEGMSYAPDLMKYLNENGIKAESADGVEVLVRTKQASAGLIVPSDFQSKIQGGESAQVILVQDKSKQLDIVGERVKVLLENYNSKLLDERLRKGSLTKGFLEPIHLESRNVATESETAGSFLSLLIPGFLIAFSLSTGLPVAVSAVAGEKTKQTLEPVLFTPVSRANLMIGKVLAVLTSVIFNIVAQASAIGFTLMAVLFVMARFMSVNKLANSAQQATTTTSLIDPAQYALSPLALGLFLLSPIPILIIGTCLQLVISSWARSEEEAYTLSLPLTFLSMIVMLAAFFMDEFIPKLWHYSLPIFGTILSMRDLLSNRVDPSSLLVMFAGSIVYALLMLGFVVWLFQREEVVFRS
jgi:sodium transport system permease protein